MPASDNSPLRAAHRLSEALLSARSPEAVSAALMEELQAALGVDQVHLTEVSQDGDVGQGRVGGSEELGYRQWLGGPSLISRVIDGGAPVAVPDAPGDPTVRQDLTERFSAASLLGVPVRWGGRSASSASSSPTSAVSTSATRSSSRRRSPTRPRSRSPCSRPSAAAPRGPSRTPR